jgi:hypothetical protein
MWSIPRRGLFIMVGGLSLGFILLSLFLALRTRQGNTKFIKQLAEATTEKRVEELTRICEEAGIKIE